MSIFLKNKLNKIVDEIVGEFQYDTMNEGFIYNIVVGKLRNGNEEVNEENIKYVIENVIKRNNEINYSKKRSKSQQPQTNSFFSRNDTRIVPMGGRKSKLRRKKRANKKTIKRRRKKCV